MNYYIQGNKDKAEEIKAAFEAKGIDTSANSNYGISNLFYFSCNGEVAVTQNGSIISIIKTHPDYKELELPIEPCFKVGDKIEATIYGIKRRVTIRVVDETNRCYFGTLAECIGFSEQDQWHLAPKPHYDISNFKPFDKVLTRFGNNDPWRADFFSHIKEDRGRYFVCVGYANRQCIPFEGNEHLFGTTDMPSEEYINW